jgi:hypothetical protein
MRPGLHRVRLRKFSAAALGAVASVAIAAGAAQQAHAAGVFVVNRLSDDAPVAGECTGGANPCSLRQAFDAAQTGAVGGTISFSVQGQINLSSSITVTGSETITVNGGTSAGSIVIDGGGLIEPFQFSLTSPHSLTVTLTNLTIQHGKGTTNGGGIYNGATLTLRDDVVQNNAVTTGSTTAANGAGLSAGGGTTTTIVASTFTGNVTTGGVGGGVPSFGGAIAIFNGGGLSLVNSTVEGNTVAGNSLDEGGGIGLLCCGTTATIVNSTIDGNAAPIGAGVDADGFSSSASATFKNDIVSGNTGGSDCASQNGGSKSAAAHNLEHGSSSCGFDVSGDPMLDAVKANGGPTPTQELLTGSAAIDAGDNPTCSSAPVNNVDQRGDLRIPAGGPICDLGAFEVQRVAAPTPTPAPTPSVPGTGATTGAASPLFAVMASVIGVAFLATACGARPRRRRHGGSPTPGGEPPAIQ